MKLLCWFWSFSFVFSLVVAQPNLFIFFIFQDIFNWLKEVPRYLIPAYFDSIVTSVYLTLINRAWSLMGE